MPKRKTTEERDREYRAEVERHKRRIRRLMGDGEYLYALEHHNFALREGDFARADALEELAGEIQAHNREVGGGVRQEVADAKRDAAGRDYERRKARDLERAGRKVEEGRRTRAALGIGEPSRPLFTPEQQRAMRGGDGPPPVLPPMSPGVSR
jgi:hypothetical protein